MCQGNQSEPKVSVIVITYNHEKYIADCLESIVSQKVNIPIEILVSDDASTDRTPEILQRYKDKFPEMILLTLREKNVGATKNSYDLLMKAKGKYIAFCEGDDFWCDDCKLQVQHDFMEAHPQFIGCSHKIRLVDREGNAKGKQRLYWVSEKKIFSLKDFQGIFLPGHVSSLFKRNLYQSEDFSVQYLADRNIGDRTTTLLYLAKGDFYQIDRVMSCYRQVAQSGAENVSSQLYVGNEDSVRMDLEYTLRLEEYAREHIRQKVNFDYHKCELLIRVLRKKNKQKEAKALAKEIYQSLNYKFMAVFRILQVFLYKIRCG